MPRPLSTGHLRPQPRVSLAGTPAAAARLAAQLGEACATALARFAPSPWKVALERVEEGGEWLLTSECKLMRFESALGSLTAQLLLDRAGLSGLIEGAMGGTGAEAPFDLAERPLSSIEGGLLQLACRGMAEEMSAAMARELGREFSHFGEETRPGDPGQSPSLTTFRYLVNVHGHAGELRLMFATAELAHQLKAGETGGGAASPGREELQRQIGRAETVLTVSLGPEALPLQQLAALCPGTLIELSSTVKTPVMVWSGNVVVYRGTLSRTGERLAVSITAGAT